MKLYIAPNGECQGIYDETLELRSLGRSQISRASHVEPTQDGHWTADLAPVGGPMLGPFPSRSQALSAEIVWLSKWIRNRHDGHS
jgi:hypothetical protein